MALAVDEAADKLGDDIAERVGALHSPLAWILLVLVVGHIAAALYHHFIERDNTLKRIAG